MQSIRQNLRPKHQVLVLRCYPRFQKNAVEVKPNSSELSYLLYYASTRRSKLEKVFLFLEKKTVSDIWRLRTGNVQVTLQIVKALIERCSRDLPLYSQSVLNILDFVLKSQDATLIQDSVDTFDAFCSHYDTATLAADVEHVRQYEEIVDEYARFASKQVHLPGKGPISFPLAVRYRTAGLQAIKALVSSNCFAADAQAHCRAFIPSILSNIYSERPGYLSLLQHQENAKESKEKEASYSKKRASMQLPRGNTNMDIKEADAAAVIGTTEDVDQKAEEEVGVLALQCLRQVYSADNRGLLRFATNALLEFALANPGNAPEKTNHKSWSAQIFELVCRWTPVQDRFVVLVTLMEALIKSPIKESDIPNQLHLVDIIDTLLRSSVNLIGLSIMDVLLGLVQHALLMLQLGGAGSHIHPHRQQADGVLSKVGSGQTSPSRDAGSIAVDMEVIQHLTAPRLLLLERIQMCMSDLATHVYYTDQIGDMVTAILSRLKPNPATAVPTAVSAITDPAGAADAMAESASLSEKPFVSGFFSFGTARLLALNSVRDILVVANSRRKDGNNPSGRNSVDVSVWNGTQWLLRDPDPKIRRAYVESLLTWLNLETGKDSLKVVDNPSRLSRPGRSPVIGEIDPGSLARRAVSNASQRTNNHQADRASFLQLLALAIFENALQFAESEPDILLMHLLLAQFVQKLGVNSVRSFLPMIFRLQETIPSLPTPEAKVCVGSLVHGYFWAISEFFEIDTSPVGRAVFIEIDRRSKSGAWLDSVHMPPQGLEQIPIPTGQQPTHQIDPTIAASASLKPFDGRPELVDSIADAYSVVLFSPPSSPPVSPGRGFSSADLPRLTQPNERALPGRVKDELLVEWSRDACVAAAEREAARASSISGSKVGSFSGSKYNVGPYGSDEALVGNGSSRPRTPAQDVVNIRLNSPARSANTPQSTGASDVLPIIRVGQLKEILAGGRMPLRPGTTASDFGDIDDTASESLLSIGRSGSNVSLPFTDAANTRNDRPVDLSEPGTANLVNEPHPRKLSLDGVSTNGSIAADSDIPPVPMLPSTAALQSKDQVLLHDERTQDPSRLAPSVHRNAGLKAGEKKGRSSMIAKHDLQALLSGAQSLPRTKPITSMPKPPY